ncbi:hypothetical protein PENTCL1PPCAC_14835, partial [Pristionchus entomophagus]
ETPGCSPSRRHCRRAASCIREKVPEPGLRLPRKQPQQESVLNKDMHVQFNSYPGAHCRSYEGDHRPCPRKQVHQRHGHAHHLPELPWQSRLLHGQGHGQRRRCLQEQAPAPLQEGAQQDQDDEGERQAGRCETHRGIQDRHRRPHKGPRPRCD